MPDQVSIFSKYFNKVGIFAKNAPPKFFLLSSQDQVYVVLLNSSPRDLECSVANLGYHNLSNIPTKDLPVRILGLGRNFVPVPRCLPKMILADSERFLRSVRLRFLFRDKENADFNPRFHVKGSTYDPPVHNTNISGYCDIVKASVQTKVSSKTPRTKLNYSKEDLRQLQQLVTNNDIVIRPADKNLGITILDGEWYRSECYRQLGDTKFYSANKFGCLSHDSYNLELRYAQLLSSHSANSSFLSRQEKKFLYSVIDDSVLNNTSRIRDRNGSIIPPWDYSPCWSYPHFYIIPKIHKTPILGRPLVPSHSYLTAKLSTYVDFQLQKVISNTANHSYILKDSKSFVNDINNLVVPSDCIMYTGDVSSLYTNIPLSSIASLISYIRESHSDLFPKQQLDFIKDSLDFIMRYNIFTFHGQVYNQIQGVAMGTPVAPSFANLYLQALEHWMFSASNYPKEARPIYYKRYIDDIFIVLRNNEKSKEMFFDTHKLAYGNLVVNWVENQCQNGIFETEFLDTVVFKDLDFSTTLCLRTRVHQKILNRYLYIPFNSCHPRHVMKSWIKTELIRYIRNSSYESDFLEIRARFASRLRARGYPAAFVRSALSQVSYDSRHILLQTRKSITPKKAPLVFVTQWHPQHNHYNLRQSLTLTPFISGYYAHKQPLIAYKRAPNLGDLINTWFKKSRFYNKSVIYLPVNHSSNPEENPNDDNVMRKQHVNSGMVLSRGTNRSLRPVNESHGSRE